MGRPFPWICRLNAQGPRGYGRYSSPPLTRAWTPIGLRRFRPRGPISFTLKAPPGSPRSGLWHLVPNPQDPLRDLPAHCLARFPRVGKERNAWAQTGLCGNRSRGAHAISGVSHPNALVPVWDGSATPFGVGDPGKGLPEPMSPVTQTHGVETRNMTLGMHIGRMDVFLSGL